MASSPRVLPDLMSCVFRMQNPQIAPRSNTTELKPEIGQSMTRQRYTGKVYDFSGTFVTSIRSQVTDFLDWSWEIAGQPFDWEHPISGNPIECLLVPNSVRISRQGNVYSVGAAFVTKPDSGDSP